MKKTIVSGAQATGNLHLGNYLGAIINWVKIQEEYNCFFFLADLHAITVDQNPAKLRSSILSTAAMYLATGLDADKTTIFAQNHVSAHSELAWIFNCITPLGWLKRMIQFKDKAGTDQENAGLGLLSYPVLMAADILLYKADYVPVGDDQKQHLELTRDIAGAINRKFNKEFFKLPLPEALIQGPAPRVMSLSDGRKKMSKSATSDLSRINLNDSSKQIIQKIKKAKTDSIGAISFDPITRPEITNLINIYSTLTGITSTEIVNKYDNKGFSTFKNDLAELTISTLEPIRVKYNDLLNNEDYLRQILKSGADKATILAHQTLKEIKELFGFI